MLYYKKLILVRIYKKFVSCKKFFYKVKVLKNIRNILNFQNIIKIREDVGIFIYNLILLENTNILLNHLFRV